MIGSHAMRASATIGELTRIEALLKAVVHRFADVSWFAAIEVEFAFVGFLLPASVDRIVGVAHISRLTDALRSVVD